MCFFKQISHLSKPEELPIPVAQIAEKYQIITGISCKVYVINMKDTFSLKNSSAHENRSYCEECPYQYDIDDIYEMLRFYRLHKKPLILGWQSQFYHWLILEEGSKKDFLFVCGPVVTEEKYLDVLCKKHMQLYNNSTNYLKTKRHLPYINKKLMPTYVHLLFNLLAIHDNNPKATEKNTFPIVNANSLLKNQNANPMAEKRFQNLYEMGENGLIEYIKNNIQKIIKYALTRDQANAKICWDNITREIFGIPDLQIAISYSIGAFSLFGQAIHDSPNFSYTPAMFSIYADFLDKINETKNIEDIIATVNYYFTALWNEIFSDEALYGSKDTSKRVIDYIMKNYQNANLSIEHISDALNISRSYMSQTFKKSTTLTVKNYLTIYRLNKAANMLLESKSTISDIAEQTGFSSPQAFRKAFRKYYKIPPSQYRKLGKPS